MSFLAQLRTQQPRDNHSGLQLCYRLQLDAQQRLCLGLYLTNINNGRLDAQPQPYCLQRQHLVMPPPFLAPADVAVLGNLMRGAEHWLYEHQHALTDADFALVEQIVASGKAYAQRQPGIWCKLHWSERKAITPCWQVAGNGQQYLSWRAANTPATAQLWHSSSVFCLYFPHSAELAPAQPGVEREACALVQSQPPLMPQEVAAFIRNSGQQWQQLGLPLPCVLEPVKLKARVEPLLYLRAGSDERGHSRDELCLEFRYYSDRLCLQRDFGATTPAQLWSGDELLQLGVDENEQQLWLEKLSAFVSDFCAAAQPGVWYCDSASTWQQLLINQRHKLETLGFAFAFARSFKHHYVAPVDWLVDIKPAGEQWQLNLSFIADGKKVNVLELLKQLQSITNHRAGDAIEVAYDGCILMLPAELAGSLAAELADLLEQYGDNATVPSSQLYRIRALKECLPEAAWHGGEQLQRQALDLYSSPVMLDRSSCDVRAELRPYQWLGVCWLQHMAASGVNGLLADDMGLGKTLQTLAHLSLEQNNGRLKAPALIVAPTSLLGNWQAELQRFCPQLSCRVVHGQHRHRWWRQGEPCDVLITSYALVARDSQQWQGVALSWLILDEAQIIKNPRTQVSQAVRQLHAQHRLCLSGTPVENHLGELWSLLDFLQPGLLGNQRQFQQYYQKPIEQDGQHQRLQQLLQRAGPLMLRRTKTQVAADLPPKTQIQQNIVFGDQQRKFYQQLKSEGWQQLTEQLQQAENNGQKHILLLTALTRLRQACCDPALLGAAEVNSAKTEYCLQMLQQLVDENRAVLVFSQFTRMLDILAAELQKLKLPYLMLTGQSKNRAQLVAAFQSGEAPIFLISLKAGGVGLNLTRADTVIHFDPWWNAAAEDQASDRAHRIGQTQPVFVYKLIAEGTIEEKIARLQQAKASISAQVNHNAESAGDTFALELKDLLALWQEENQT